MAGKSAEELALQGGEDYKLLFSCSPDKAPRLAKAFAQESLAAPNRIGEIVAGAEVFLITDKKEKVISGAGYEHFRLDPRKSSD